MMRRIINSSLRFRVLAVAAAVAILAFGVTQLRNAPVDVYPEFSPPTVEIQTEALGLSAGEVEQLITVPLEADLLNGVAWVTDIRSESVTGLSSVTLIFEHGTELFRARQAVQERLAQAHALPNVSKPPQMVPPVSSTSRTMMVGLSSEKLSLIEISQLARWTIKPRLMGVEGVGNVASFGQRERQLQVQVDPKRLNEKQVNLQQIIETTGNALTVSPLSYLEASTPGTGGFVETTNQRLGVRHISPIVSAGDLAKVAVVEKEGLSLGDVATIVEDHQPLIGDAIVNGKPGVMLVVEKLRGANTVEVTEGVEAALETLRPGLGGLKMDTTIYRPADYVKSASNNVGKGLLIGMAAAILLLGFALYQWRTALVGVMAILVSMTAAGIVLYLRGATFNSMTMAGLAIALGLVIDDAITGADAVARRIRQRGTRSIAAAIVEASVDVRSALAYATLFVLLPVVPLFFTGGLLGSFGRPLAVSYVLALFVSMLTALFITPALSVLVYSGAAGAGAGKESALMSTVGRRYEGLLGRVLTIPKRAFITVGLIALVGVAVLPTMRSSKLPDLQERDFMVELAAAPATSLQEMNRITAEVTAELGALPGVRNVAGHLGRAVTGDQVVDVNSAKLWVSLDRKADYTKSVAAVEKVAAGHAELNPRVLSYQKSQLKGADGPEEGTTAPIVVRVYGNEPKELAKRATAVGKTLTGVEGIKDLRVDLPVQQPTLEVEVDLERAKEFGVKPGDVRRSAAILLSGLDVGQLFNDQKVFDVVVRSTPESRQNEADIRNLLIDTPSGKQIRLEDVADVKRVNSPDVIQREGVFRRIDITANVEGRSRDAVASDVRQTIEDLDFPLEFRAELLGGFAEKEATEQRLFALGAFVALAMLLLLQACFGSWRFGTILFLTLPISLLGGVVAAVASKGSVTIGASLGLLAVLGIAARNGILLVKRYQQMERREEELLGADLVRHGARERLAPTLMTALATGLVFAPFVFAGGRPGYEILHPMGIVVLGGLFTATLVNVFVIPGLYLHFTSVKSETELDLHLFEEELRVIDLTDRATSGAARATDRAAAPVNGTTAEPTPAIDSPLS